MNYSMFALRISISICILFCGVVQVFPKIPEKKSELNRYKITITAGIFDRENTIISFFLPNNQDDGVYLMEDESGNTEYLQVVNGKAYFVLNRLPSGESKIYHMVDKVLSVDDFSLKITKELTANSVIFASDGNKILNYFHKESNIPEGVDIRFKRGGYIHPVYTPEGVRVTQDFNRGRPHQYGIWSAWAYSDFQNRTTEFWGSHIESGRIVVDSLKQTWKGPVLGGFISSHKFVDFSATEPVTALNEEWTVNIFPPARGSNYHIFDMYINQTANTDNPVKILQHQYGYGGINVRGHDEWNGVGKMSFLSSEGYNRKEVSFKGVRWSHFGGYIEGKQAGIGVFGHPENQSHPLGVFINEVEPFFSYGPIPIGNLLIEPGTPYVVRYRFLIHDGEIQENEVEKMWNDYAYPPGVTVARL